MLQIIGRFPWLHSVKTSLLLAHRVGFWRLKCCRKDVGGWGEWRQARSRYVAVNTGQRKTKSILRKLARFVGWFHCGTVRWHRWSQWSVKQNLHTVCSCLWWLTIDKKLLQQVEFSHTLFEEMLVSLIKKWLHNNHQEIQIRTRSYHFPSVRMAVIKKTRDNRCWCDVVKWEYLYAVGRI